MAVPFSRSLRSLATDGRSARRGGLALSLVFLGGWLVWFLRSEVAVYEITDVARVEAAELAYRAEVPVGGKVVATRLALGREVAVGDVLVELDSASDALDLAEKRTQIRGLVAEIAPLEAQIAAAKRVLDASRDVTRGTADEARVRHRDADAAAIYAEAEAERTARLRTEGLASDSDVARMRSTAKSRRADEQAARIAVDRIGAEHRAHESELAAEVARLERELQSLEAQRAKETAAVAGLEYRIEQRTIRAPVAGRLGEITALQIGSVLRAGDKVAAVVPGTALRVVADFPAAKAVGRVRRGQPGRVRLTGFPWTQWGVLGATVSRVASEAQAGRVRVELALVPDPASAIPVQHGLQGTAEVEVERVSPATLVLRAAGSFVRRASDVEGAPDTTSGATPVAGASP